MGIARESAQRSADSGVSAYRFATHPTQARRHLGRYARMFDNGIVADIGAGRGYFLEALRDRGVEGIGVDLAEESVVAGERIGIRITQGDAIDFLAHQRDLGGVFISHLVEHLPPDVVQALLAAAHAAMRPGGTVVVVTPNPRDLMVITELFWLDPTHVRPYPSKLVSAMLEAAGFVVTATGVQAAPFGRRQRLGILLNRLRFGREYGRTELWVRAERRAEAS